MSVVFSRIGVKRTTWPGACLVGAVLLVALLVAAVSVPAAVWPDSYPPALAAGLAVSVAVAAVGLLAILLRRRTRERVIAVAELEALRAAMPVAVVAVDLDGAVLHWNASAEALYDYDAEEMTGRLFSVLEGDDGDGVIEAVREGEHFADSEAVHRRRTEPRSRFPSPWLRSVVRRAKPRAPS
jgi:PAS domain-containing protein